MEIGNDAFKNITSLQSIYLPESVDSIGDNSFYGCSNLTEVYLMSEIPPTLGSSVFNGVSSTLKIYVPSGFVGAYQSADGWSAYAEKIEAHNF